MRFATPVGAVAVLAILLFGTGAAAACAPPPTSPPYTVLDTIPLVDAIAANSTTVFAQGVANCANIWGINTSDSVFLYATVPVPNSACDEGGLALAPNTTYTGSGQGHGHQSAPRQDGPNLGAGAEFYGQCHCSGAKANTTLFDVVAGQLFAITQNGTNVTLVATFSVPSKTSENMGLAWDQVGRFHHDLIVTSSSGGKVWLVNSTGGVTLFAQLHTYIGGPAVAPKNFWPFGGDIIIAEKRAGSIVALAPNGTVSVVAPWSEANAVTFPFAYSHAPWSGGWGGWNGVAQWGNGGGGCGRGCSFGPDHDMLFVANYSSGAVEAFPASDLYGYYGMGFVAGGLNQGIGAFASSGFTTYFATQTQRLSGIASVYCPPPPTCGGGYGGGQYLPTH